MQSILYFFISSVASIHRFIKSRFQSGFILLEEGTIDIQKLGTSKNSSTYKHLSKPNFMYALSLLPVHCTDLLKVCSKVQITVGTISQISTLRILKLSINLGT